MIAGLFIRSKRTIPHDCATSKAAEAAGRRRLHKVCVVGLAGALLLGHLMPAAARDRVTFASPEAALDQGIGAYRAGYFQIALQALRYAADHRLLVGEYHLGQLYADNQSAMTDHAKAYELFLRIAQRHASTIDVEDDARAPYVGKALTALARYNYRGLPEAGVERNVAAAAAYLEEAATFFRDPDGQYELAKLYLTGEGVPQDRRKALYWLSRLAQDGHVGAQAFFAQLLWEGKVVNKDERRALALVTIAAENAPPHERFWIDDIHQRIFCGMLPGVRQQAEGLVASYRHSYVQRSDASPTSERVASELALTRTCGNGEVVPLLQQRGDLTPTETAGAVIPKSDPAPPAYRGNSLGFREGAPRR
ncbi:MAG: tetratricopeptide repeat protein [Hyphomicrobiaceae bacterium]